MTSTTTLADNNGAATEQPQQAHNAAPPQASKTSMPLQTAAGVIGALSMGPSSSAPPGTNSLLSAAVADQQQQSSDGLDMTNLIVNYLPHSVTDSALQEMFAPFGVVEHVKVVLDRMTGQSAGYGFVRFANAESARKAHEAMSGIRMQNKVLKVSYARPSSHDIKHANLYIANLGPLFTKDQLVTLFAPFGAIIDARLLIDPKTGTSRGVGFVRFDRHSEADLAIKTLDGKTLSNGGVQLVVKFADRDPHNPKMPRSAADRSYSAPDSYGSQYNVAPGPHAPYPPTGHYGGQSVMHQQMGMTHSHQGFGLYVSGLPEHADENMLFRLFGPFGTVVQVKIVRHHPSGPCKGYGFVNMLSYQDAMRAIMYMNGYQITPDRLLHVAFKK